MISKKMFSDIINELLLEYNQSCKKDRALTKAFGGDSYIVQENKIIDNILNILKRELNDKDDLIDWLFFENLINNKQMYFTYNNNKRTKCTIENIYNCLISNECSKND